MGSFNSLCAISGLPITYGTPVRFMLLTQNPYADDWCKCYQYSIWVPRTFPIKAKYNDYGSVDHIEEGATRDVWFEAFQRDLVECGVGDNSFHDLAVSKDMDFDDFLEALQKERVRVKRRTAPIQEEELRKALDRANALLKEVSPKRNLDEEPKVERGEPGFPTLESIQALIKAAGLPLSNDASTPGYHVDEQAWGSVRIRWSKFAEPGSQQLEALPPLLGEYACMICAGSGNYPNDAEVIVRPKPGNREGGGKRSVHLPDPDGDLLVMQAMIREDVWQALLKQPLDKGYNFNTKKYETNTLEKFKQGIRAYLKHREEKLGAVTDIKDLLFDSLDRDFVLNYPGSWVVDRRESAMMTMGPSDHWQLMQQKGPLPEEFIDTAAEYAYVYCVLGQLGYWWKPSYSIGGQDPAWKGKLKYLQELVKLVKAEVKEQEDI